MLLKIIKRKINLISTLNLQWIIFFTFVPRMKENNKTQQRNNQSDRKSTSVTTTALPSAYLIHLFENLKAFNEKLLIVFANIRVWKIVLKFCF